MHLTLTIGWIGGAVAFLVVVVSAMRAGAERTVIGAWAAMEVIGSTALVPLAIGSLASGVALALGTRWGLFRHYWVTISLALTALAFLVLLANMSMVRQYAALAAAPSPEPATLRRALPGELVHSGLGVLVLFVVQVLNVYKPKGMTRYGWRRQHQGMTVG